VGLLRHLHVERHLGRSELRRWVQLHRGHRRALPRNLRPRRGQSVQVSMQGISCMTTNNFCFCLQNRLIQTSQTGGQRYSDTSPFSIPWSMI
jgi:hypothetical protein